MTDQQTITFEDPLTRYTECILCKKHKREQGYFCEKCFKKPFFTRLRAFKNSVYLKEGLQQMKNYKQHYGRFEYR